ncbi:porin [Roseovarius aestuariivivens]|uniref:porin n=1 Tax=Roseovarius aestuariivivens TaxID=1888910 RepID=UPI001081368C|nr:porin [Roseovarius aestuariivivens]
MKKQLLCTSAIALGVAAAAPASAQDWNLDWGGFFNQHIAFTDVSGSAFNVGGPLNGVDFDGIQMYSNTEIIFTPSITLDNGLTFGVNIQMEGLNSGGGADGIDESYMSISGDQFGRLDIGYENSAGYKMMVGAPAVASNAINSPSASAFIPFHPGAALGFRQAAISSFTEVAGNNDTARLTYYTPSFNGFTAGISYAPTAGGNTANVAPVNRNAGIVDVIDLGVNYSQSFGTTDISLAARWGTADNNAVGVSDPETWGVGFQVGFSGFTVGGSWAENDNGAPTGVGDQEGYSLGVAYDAPGPWTFGLEGYVGEVEQGAIDGEYEYYQLAGSRDLGPGVSWDVYLVYGETKAGSAAPAFLVPGSTIDGTAIGTAINLSF